MVNRQSCVHLFIDTTNNLIFVIIGGVLMLIFCCSRCADQYSSCHGVCVCTHTHNGCIRASCVKFSTKFSSMHFYVRLFVTNPVHQLHLVSSMHVALGWHNPMHEPSRTMDLGF